MLITVVVPVFNVESYLEKCVNSICKSTYKNIEIILVDDGSTDYSGDICDICKTKDKRISVVHKSNGGLSSARNAGIELAKGEYILFIDSDDFIENTMIEHLADAAKKYGAEVIQGGYKKVDEHLKVHYQFVPNNKICNEKKEILEEFLINSNISVIACGKLFKSKLFKNGLRFMEGRNHEDNIFLADLLEYIQSYVSINKAEYLYLIRNESIVNQKFNEKKLDAIYAMRYMINKIEIKWPSYSKYIRALECRICFQLYCNYTRSGEPNTRYRNIILNEFNKNIQYLKNVKCGKREKIELIIFKYYPDFIAKLHNKISKRKYKKKST